MPRPIIVGGGPGGLATAFELARLGIESMVLEKESYPRDKICGDACSGKVMACLPPEWASEIRASNFQLGSWGVCFRAPGGKVLEVPFRQGPQSGDPAPGFIARRIDFDNFLGEKALANPMIAVVQNANVRKIEQRAFGIYVEASDGRSWLAPIVVGAGGAHGIVGRQLAGIAPASRHQAAGVRAYYNGVKGLHPHNFIELHFLKPALPGYLWVFPLTAGAANVGLGLRSDYVARRRINLRKLLIELIATHPDLAVRFREARLQGPVKGFGLPFGSRHVPRSGDGFVLVGDEAWLIDPFTGEGIGNAMLSGKWAARQIAEAWLGQDFSAGKLAAYDDIIRQKLGPELKLGYGLQRLSRFPWLLNFVIAKALRSPELQGTITAMFDEADLRGRFRNPLFYMRMVFA